MRFINGLDTNYNIIVIRHYWCRSRRFCYLFNDGKAIYFIIIVVLKTMKLNVSNVSSMKRLMIYFMKWIYWGKEIKVLHYVIKK